MIKNLRDLAEHVGVDPVTSFDNFGAGGLAGRVAKAIFKGTECGCVFDVMVQTPHADAKSGIRISGYAEGADADCPSYELEYPFTKDAFDLALECADEDGIEMWNEWNSEDWNDVFPDDVMEDEA